VSRAHLVRSRPWLPCGQCGRSCFFEVLLLWGIDADLGFAITILDLQRIKLWMPEAYQEDITCENRGHVTWCEY
jgi:hypothetical protein